MELSFMKKREIEARVTDLLTQYGYVSERDTYLDVVDFAQKRGFVVGNAELPEGEDGFLAIQPGTFKKDGTKIIGVNVNRSLEWKRFIIAHELAHSVLHYREGEIYLHRESRKGKNSDENDADYFAAALLMPEGSFSRMHRSLNDGSRDRSTICSELSKIYRVPFESASRRIDEILLES